MDKTPLYEKLFNTAMDRMFMAVGFDGFDENFVKQDHWYTKKTWTIEQESEYRQWLINECRTKLRMRKKAAELEAGYFLLMWGWSTTN